MRTRSQTPVTGKSEFTCLFIKKCLICFYISNQLLTVFILIFNKAGGRNPLQNSHLTNQMSSHREPVAQNKVCVFEFPLITPVSAFQIL